MTERPDDVTGRADRIEYEAMYDLWRAVGDEARAAGDLVTGRAGDCLVMGCGALPSVAMVNRVMGATAASIADGTLADAIDLLRERGCACQIGLYDDSDDDRALRPWLEDRGFTDGYAWMKFVHSGVLPQPAGRASEVGARLCEPADAATFGETFVAGFELPGFFAPIAAAAVGREGWRCYLAETPDGTPVGTGAMFIHGTSAWLGFGATTPQARGRGAQTAVLRARVADALEAGCSLIVTETGERVEGRPSISYGNILRAGFVEHRVRRNLVAMPPAGQS